MATEKIELLDQNKPMATYFFYTVYTIQYKLFGFWRYLYLTRVIYNVKTTFIKMYCICCTEFRD